MLGACLPPPPPPPPTRGSHFAAVADVTAFTRTAPPEGASNPGTAEWYRAPAPGGTNVELAVYRPAGPPQATVLLLHGGSGLRRGYEDLAQRFAGIGILTVVGCWSDDPTMLWDDQQVSCVGGPTWKGSSTGVAGDIAALLTAMTLVPGTGDPSRFVLVGHSYGAAAALVHAAVTGSTLPVVSIAGLLAATPTCDCTPRAGDRYADTEAAAIAAPVLVVHGRSDPITPIGQADTFAAAMNAAGHPVDRITYPAPAGHSLPWQVDLLASGQTIATATVTEVAAWIRSRLGVTGLDVTGSVPSPQPARTGPAGEL